MIKTMRDVKSIAILILLLLIEKKLNEIGYCRKDVAMLNYLLKI